MKRALWQIHHWRMRPCSKLNRTRSLSAFGLLRASQRFHPMISTVSFALAQNWTKPHLPPSSRSFSIGETDGRCAASPGSAGPSICIDGQSPNDLYHLSRSIESLASCTGMQERKSNISMPACSRLVSPANQSPVHGSTTAATWRKRLTLTECDLFRARAAALIDATGLAYLACRVHGQAPF